MMSTQSTRGAEGGPPIPLLDFAPDEACRAAIVADRAVGSYPTLSPLPASLEPESLQDANILTLGHRCFFGGLLSVALAVEQVPKNHALPDIIRHHALWSPDFPRNKPQGGLSATVGFIAMP